MPETAEESKIIETVGTGAVVTSVTLASGKRKIGLRTASGGKKYKSIVVASGETFYSSPYLSWASHFKCYNLPAQFELVSRNRLLVAKGDGKCFPDREDAISDAIEVQKRYGSDEVGFDYRANHAKSSPNDNYSETDTICTYVLFRQGCLSDYFRLSDIYSVLESGGIDAAVVADALGRLFIRPISELVAEDLNGFRLEPSMFGGYRKSGDSFTFRPFFQTDAQFVAGQLLRGEPAEAIAVQLMDRRAGNI